MKIAHDRYSVVVAIDSFRAFLPVPSIRQGVELDKTIAVQI